ncbi:AEC family transporter [Psychrobacter sp. FDAARGOS_221]|uniref:AEC family transporter n=1 Tax=Psychrobacter sp. FDAARGOS_221 TaxID=1975705 RepID=UPI000BB55998|nr:AEC family transporter [Psychrobacter sp. FDAARGOS_221]PNK60776.1 AEC family transporter [Psychrobacter sp. FDAARGOS_221]
MIDIINITVPIFIIIALGYLSVRTRIIDPSHSKGMGTLVLYIALPALMFNAIAQMPFQEVISPRYLLIYAIGSVLAFVIGVILTKGVWRQDNVSAALNSTALAYANSAFIGFAALSAVIGATKAATYLSMVVLIESFIMLPMLFIMAGMSADGSQSWGQLFRRIAKNLSRNPLIIAIIVSVSFSVFSIPVPQVAAKTAEMLSGVAAPVALFVIGMSLYGLELKGDLPKITTIGLGKLIVHPLMMLLAIMLIPSASIEHKYVAMLFASAPTFSTIAIIGQYYGLVDRVSAIVIISTVGSFFSMSAVLMYWEMTIGF